MLFVYFLNNSEEEKIGVGGVRRRGWGKEIFVNILGGSELNWTNSGVHS